MRDLFNRHALVVAAVIFAGLSGAALVRAVIDFGGGFDNVDQWLLLIAAILAAGLAFVLLSYAPAGPNYVAKAKPVMGDKLSGFIRAFVSRASGGFWQIGLGAVLTSIGTYYIFEFDGSGGGSVVFWSGLTFVGVAILLAGIAQHATEEVPGNEEIRVIRAINDRAQRAAVRASSAATEAKRLTGLMPEADEVISVSDSASSRAERARALAEQAADVEDEARDLAIRLLQLQEEAADIARRAETDLDYTRGALEQVEELVRQRRLAEQEPTPGAGTDEGEA